MTRKVMSSSNASNAKGALADKKDQSRQNADQSAGAVGRLAAKLKTRGLSQSPNR
jgi:hypothetical protein